MTLVGWGGVGEAMRQGADISLGCESAGGSMPHRPGQTGEPLLPRGKGARGSTPPQRPQTCVSEGGVVSPLHETRHLT